MEYSLNYLNLISKLKGLTLTEFINSLNLIGLEVDQVSKDSIKSNYSLNNVKFLVKIPSNREDLLIENFFLDELSIIFLIALVELWENIKKKYQFLSKQKYTEYSNYLEKPIETELPFVTTFAIQLKNFQNFSSPLWIQKKLLNSGIDIQNNFEDVINLTMLEWGQLFVVGKKQNNENKNLASNYTLSYLNESRNWIEKNGKKIELSEKSIILKNQENEILTVVGLINKIEEKSTEKLFLQLTYYDIDKHNKLIDLYNPKTSMKYFRKMFFEQLKFSFQRLLTLIEILEYGNIEKIKYRTPKQTTKIQSTKLLKLQRQTFVNILGISEINQTIFNKTGLSLVCKTKENLYFNILKKRKDITREIDLIEEYSRFFGFKNFQEILPLKKKFKVEKFHTISFFKQFFLNYGFNEVITNSICEIPKENYRKIEINNPLTKEFSNLRISILPQLLEIFDKNFRITSGIGTNNFFEIGRTFQNYNSQIIEEEKLSAVFQFPKYSQLSLDWFVHLGFLENLLQLFGYSNITKEKLDVSYSLLHPKRSIVIKSQDKVLGFFGQLTPNYKNSYLLKNPVYLLELNLIHFDITQTYTKISLFQDYSKYPKIIKDLSCIVSKDINFSLLKKSLENSSEYLKRIYFFDIYFEKNLENSISLGIRLEFQSSTMTLTGQKIDFELESIKSNLYNNFQIKIS